MIVYIDGEKYDSRETPIVIDFEGNEKREIANMDDDDSRYLVAPAGSKRERLVELILDPENPPEDIIQSSEERTINGLGNLPVDVKGRANVKDSDESDDKD